MKVISTIEEKKKASARRVAEVRLRFKQARLFLNPLNNLIQLAFKKKKKGSTALGNAMSHVLRNAIEGAYPNIWVNAAEVRISDGIVSLLQDVAVQRSGGNIFLRWADNSGDGGSYAQWDDQVILCAYDEPGGVAGINSDRANRADEQLNLQLPSGMEDKAVHLYLLLHDRDRQSFSRSEYLGMLVE